MPASKPTSLNYQNIKELKDQLNFLFDDVYSKLDIALGLNNKGVMQTLQYGGLGKDVSGFDGLLQITEEETHEVTLDDTLNLVDHILGADVEQIFIEAEALGLITGGDMLGENKLTVLVDISATGWKEVGTHEVATLTGAAIVRTAVRCVTLGPSAADNISYGIEGNTSFWIGATARNSIVVNQFWLTTTGSTVSAPLLLEGISATSHVKSATLESVDIGYQIYSTVPTQGWLEFTFWWTPISEGATLIAGSGGTL